LPCGGDNRLMKTVLAELGFKRHRAQTNGPQEIRVDMGCPPSPKASARQACIRMRRLLRGDVRFRQTKPPCRVQSALIALERDSTWALMAPTRILAEQQFP